MLLIGALALGLVESTNSNLGINSLNYSTVASSSGSGGGGGAGSGIGSVIGMDGGDGGVNPMIETAAAGVGVSSSGSSVGGVYSAVSIFSQPTMNAVTGHGGGGGGSVGGMIVTSSNTGGALSWDNNATIRSATTGDWSIEQCIIWQRPHHMYFQLGNAFLLLAFLAPHRPFGILWLRAMLVVGAILLAMYGYLIDCAQDVVLWSSLFFGVNTIYLIAALCRLRPVRFDREIDAVRKFSHENNLPPKALLLIDNCTAHKPIDLLKTEDGNIIAMLFPPNVTPVLQPMDQNPIRLVKLGYRNKLLCNMLAEENISIDRMLKLHTIRQAILMLKAAWDELLPSVLSNSWNKICKQVG